MQVDYAVLKTRIQALLGNVVQTPPPVVSDAAYTPLKDFLRPLIESEVVRAEILKKGMKIVDGCQDCLRHAALKKAKVVGSGFNGTVFDMGKGRAVKVELVTSTEYLDGPVHAGEVAMLMGKLGVGPQVHSWRLCACQFATYLVIEMDLIRGSPVREWRQAKHIPAVMAKVKDALTKKVLKMHKAGYLHNDLNLGNVVIDKKNVPWIIDFSYMKTTGGKGAQKKDDVVEQNLRVVDFLAKEPPGREAADSVVNRVFDSLVHEGVLKTYNGQFVDTKFSAFGQM